jgi:hypothetical protein
VIKLRSIEILVQQQAEVLEGQGKAEDPTLHNIQAILYSTEVRSLLHAVDTEIYCRLSVDTIDITVLW